MTVRFLGVGELGASATPGDVLKTMALGSCIAVILHEPTFPCAGMVHVALPDSQIHPARAEALPGYFADTGIPALLREMATHGGHCPPASYTVKLVGGSNVMDARGKFRVGERNAEAIRAILRQRGMNVAATETGGTISRTVHLDVATGAVRVLTPGEPTRVL
jgi:chemotaxis protein CheD